MQRSPGIHEDESVTCYKQYMQVGTDAGLTGKDMLAFANAKVEEINRMMMEKEKLVVERQKLIASEKQEKMEREKLEEKMKQREVTQKLEQAKIEAIDLHLPLSLVNVQSRQHKHLTVLLNKCILKTTR